VARRDGVSSTGTAHGLLVETAGDGTITFTVTGANGTKRHAAVTLSNADVDGLVETIYRHILDSERNADDDADDDADWIVGWEEQDA
jgi:hypothetical protein